MNSTNELCFERSVLLVLLLYLWARARAMDDGRYLSEWYSYGHGCAYSYDNQLSSYIPTWHDMAGVPEGNTGQISNQTPWSVMLHQYT